MKKHNIAFGIVFVAVAGAVLFFYTGPRAVAPGVSGARSPADATYMIEGRTVALKNGSAEETVAPGSATKITTGIFGAGTTGDVNGDGKDDAVVILKQDPGGSGTFYYAAIAIRGESGYIGSNAILLGDRIAPQNIEVRNGMIAVNYADRYPWESFIERPSVGKSKYLKYEGGTLQEVPQEQLTQTAAETLVSGKWGRCTPDACSKLTVSVLDGKDGVWYVEAVYDGMRDDSLKALKRIASAHYVSGTWEFGAELVREYVCQPGRGHQDFSEELCL